MSRTLSQAFPFSLSLNVFPAENTIYNLTLKSVSAALSLIFLAASLFLTPPRAHPAVSMFKYIQTQTSSYCPAALILHWHNFSPQIPEMASSELHFALLTSILT